MAPSATNDAVSRPQSVVTDEWPHADNTSSLRALCHGPIVLEGIPSFSSHQAHREHILVHMAAVFRQWARQGFTEGISGHISVRDPEWDDYIWMNPLGRHFAMMRATDMMCIDIHSGKIVGGNKTRPANSPGFYIHSEIHKARKDLHAVCHAHTIAGRAWSVFGKPLDMITQDVCDLYECLVTDGEYGGIVTAEEEGRRIAGVLGTQGKAAILMNHGLLTAGHTVDEAGFLFGLLDRSCAIQLRVEAACNGNSSLKKMTIPREQALANARLVNEKNWLYVEAQPDIELEMEMAGDVISRGVQGMTVDA